MRTFESLDDFVGVVGQVLGTSCWHTVDQQRIEAFFEATRDRRRGRGDPERGVSGPDGASVTPEYLMLSLLPRLTDEMYRVEGVALGVNYGLDHVRFTSPVQSGSRIRATAVLRDVTPVAMGFRCVVGYVIECDATDEPPCIADNTFILVPK